MSHLSHAAVTHETGETAVMFETVVTVETALTHETGETAVTFETIVTVETAVTQETGKTAVTNETDTMVAEAIMACSKNSVIFSKSSPCYSSHQTN